MLILEKIMAAAANHENSIAIHSLYGELSYHSLWEQSDRLAFWLDERLKENKKPIVVYGHKSPLMLMCFLACVKSGRAYCPVDTSMPMERIETIIQSVGNPLILATEPLDITGYYVVDGHLLTGVASSGERISKDKWVGEEDLFYIIFTSGSTGNPKGVQITNRNLSRFTDWSVTLADDFSSKEGKHFLNQAPFSFDLSVMDVYTSLCAGGTLWCLDKKVQADAASMLTYMKEGNLNYWISTPSFADMCLADKNFDHRLLPEIKAFLFCGEKLTKETVRKLFDRFPGAKVINTYGPTESTVAVTGAEMTEKMLEAEESLPIGMAKPGTRILIDEGEILISGDTVSPGYFNDEEKTAKSFVKFCSEEGREAVCYRTGDEGYFKDGMLYYRGRMDLQIKFHGYRIELGDIESNLMELPGVSAATVVPRKTGEKIRNLVAFVKAEGLEGTFADGQNIRNRLKTKLPEYMVPKKVIFVESLPMTGNGKTDRKKLEMCL